ncbi:CgeB family protein [Velocimicrobium porci]|mgnify:CR=1 FL=1|uniref:Glycosyltransferase n=1 Tax=Velocimicrobium porci TaxID=2606634 RepID=A0A6L5XYC2_9FIRM|nr:DUF3880 domain-containing protein [Velocimicrobium porci]MSS63866.1 glycosyltransferase [Velocimicrobium porci]
MKVLMCNWKGLGQEAVYNILLKKNYCVDRIIWQEIRGFEEDEYLENCLIEKLRMERYQFVITINYFPIISKTCERYGVKYIAWTTDSPLYTLFSKTIYNSCNYFFIFDRDSYMDLKNRGVSNVYYLPLGFDADSFSNLEITENDKEKYSCDVSFVGSLYRERTYYQYLERLPEYLKGYFEGIISAQQKIWGYNFMEELLDDSIMKELKKYISFVDSEKNYIGTEKLLFANSFLGVEVTARERERYIREAASKFLVDIYTGSDVSDIRNIRNKGYVDYLQEMPKVFRLSKINLNITLRTIKSGLPLRIWDIIGNQGFLLTNYQEEIPDFFEIDKDLVCFESEKDMMEKIDYYLKHDDERKEIIQNGYQKVMKYHRMEQRITQILELIGEN